MAHEQVSMLKFAMKFGVIGAVIAIALTLLFFVLDLSESPLIQIPRYLLMLAIILWGQFEYRRAETLAIGYGETLDLAMLIMLYFTVLVTGYTIIHWHFIDTEIASRSVAAAEAILRSQNLPEQQLKSALQMQKNFIGPIVAPLFGSISIMLIGAIMSLIISIFTRRSTAVTSS